MFIILSKIFGFLLQPLAWITICLLLSFAIQTHWKNRFRKLAVAIFILFSNGFLFEEVQRLWMVPPMEDRNIPEDITTAVVLGGFSNYDQTLERIQFHQAADRFWQAFRLSHQNCIDTLLIAGGSGRIREPENKESKFVRRFLEDINYTKAVILTEENSKNTYENALFSKELIGAKKILLVTSESHMRRARACFEKQGFEVIAYTTDRQVGKRKFYFEHLILPNFGVLGAWTGLFHEIIGYLSYSTADYL